MSRFDDELRDAARQLAREPLPPDALDEALEADRPARRPVAILASVAGALLVAVLAVGIGGERLLPSESTAPSAAAGEASQEVDVAGCDATSAAASVGKLRIWFPCGVAPAEPVAVLRDAEEDVGPAERLRSALTALFAGPTEDEEDRGLQALLPAGTADGFLTDAELLDEVEYLDDGLARVSFTARLEEVNNLSTSAAAGAFIRAIQSTVLDLPEVTAVELQVAGSCDRFYAFFESTCQYLAEPLPEFACALIEPAELPSGARADAARPYPSQPLVVWGADSDTVTGSVTPGEPSPGGESVEIRGLSGWVRPTGDRPLPEPYEIAWGEDGCAYSYYVQIEGGEEAALEYAARLSGEAPETVSRPVRAEAEADGVWMSVTLDRDRIADGQVLFATTIVENRSDFSRFWSSSGEGDCDWAVRLQVRPVIPLARGQEWEGEPLRLKRGLLGLWGIPEEILETPHSFVAARRLPNLTSGCFPEFGGTELLPGESVTDELAWRATGPLGMPLPPGTYEVEAEFMRVTADGEPASDDPLPRLVIPIEVVGPEIDYLDPGLAIDVALVDPEFRELLAGLRPSQWGRQSMAFDDGIWRITLIAGVPPAIDYTIVAEIDALDGQLIDVRVVEP